VREFFDIFVAKKVQYALLTLLIILSLGWLVTFFAIDRGDSFNAELGRRAEYQEAFNYSNGALKGFGGFLAIRTKIELISENAGFSHMCRGVRDGDGAYATLSVSRYTFFGVRLRSEVIEACK